MSTKSRISIGGCFRCCIQAVIDKTTPDFEGEEITCACGGKMILKDDLWMSEVARDMDKWRHPEPPVYSVVADDQITGN